jgi:hypothetical protein
MKPCLCGHPVDECLRNRSLDNLGLQFHAGRNGTPYYPDACVAPQERTAIIQRDFDFPVASISYAAAVLQTAQHATEFNINEQVSLVAQMFRCHKEDVMRDVRATRTKHGYPKSMPERRAGAELVAASDGGREDGEPHREPLPDNVRPLFPR